VLRQTQAGDWEAGYVGEDGWELGGGDAEPLGEGCGVLDTASGGAQRPFEPESSGPLRTGVGKVTYILPPLAPPPMTMWWEPQAWSEPVGVGLEGVACSLAWSLSARFFPPIPGYWQPVSFRLS
jgi:hypothetical protein